MPLKERHNLTVRLTCQRPGCGVSFHPWRGREESQHYCSNDCSRAAGTFTRSGKWPKLPSNTRANVTLSESPSAPVPQVALPEPYDPDRERAQWLEAGERWERIAEVAEQTVRGERRTLFVGGHGAYLGVAHGALVVESGRTHGAPGEREVLHPALHDAGRIVVVGTAATLTAAALAWCRAEGISCSLLADDGTLLAQTVPPPDRVRDDVALRRRQYTLSPEEQAGIARAILRRKLEGQRRALLCHPELPDREALQRATEAFAMALSWLTFCDEHGPTDYLRDLTGIMTFEARCARAYFDALAALPLRFARADLTRGIIPPHWMTFGQRTSPRAPNGNARHAVRPGQAILNYAYGCLESQCRTALVSAGFDPACGILHADKPNRDSLVFDLMELERANVDNLVLRFIASGTPFHAADFAKATDGSVKLHPQLARAVVASCRVSEQRLDEHAHWVRRVLLAEPGETVEPGELAEATRTTQPAAVAVH
jgi:CRISP-associated protein Cas1